MNQNFLSKGVNSWIALGLILILLIFESCSSTGKKQKEIRPNIIFLLTDDHRWDALGVNGDTIVRTPKLDKLAKEGFNFKNAYVTTSICMVSRASILSGQYMSRHGINDFFTSFSDSTLQKTYPAILKEKGYHIGFVGKYGVGEPKDQPSEMFDFWAGTPMHQPNYETIDKNGDSIHYTDLISSEINNFLKLEKNKEPFCLSVSFKSPHSQDGDPRQFIPMEKYDNLYNEIEIPQPETALPYYWNLMPSFFHTEENIARNRWKLRFKTPEKYQESVKNYYRLITGVDDAVGKLINLLKERGLAENTIIIFMGDNGMYMGEHGLAGKWFGHEESIRVPLIIYDPRNPEGSKTIEKIALNIDIAPTILSYAGIEPSEEMQGLNLQRIIEGENVNREAFFYEHTFEGSPALPKVEGVVSPSTKYMKYIEHDFEELYDLTEDPYEKNNLAEDPEFRELMEQQRKLYKSEKNKAVN